MKTYSSGTTKDKKKKGFFKKNLYAILFGSSLLVVAAVITLTLVFTRPTQAGTTPQPPVDNNPGVNGPSAPTFTLPMDDCTLGKEAALDSLVYSATLNQWRSHNGVDFNGAAGATVKAVSDGKVKSVVETNLEGWVVTIEHADGLVSIYKGLDREGLAAEGAAVKTGDSIGKLAETMMLEQLDGVHLHLEMKKNGALVNPLDYLPEAGSEK